jgi:hypothetical protein
MRQRPGKMQQLWHAVGRLVGGAIILVAGAAYAHVSRRDRRDGRRPRADPRDRKASKRRGKPLKITIARPRTQDDSE